MCIVKGLKHPVQLKLTNLNTISIKCQKKAAESLLLNDIPYMYTVKCQTNWPAGVCHLYRTLPLPLRGRADTPHSCPLSGALAVWKSSQCRSSYPTQEYEQEQASAYVVKVSVNTNATIFQSKFHRSCIQTFSFSLMETLNLGSDLSVQDDTASLAMDSWCAVNNQVQGRICASGLKLIKCEVCFLCDKPPTFLRHQWKWADQNKSYIKKTFLHHVPSLS